MFDRMPDAMSEPNAFEMRLPQLHHHHHTSVKHRKGWAYIHVRKNGRSQSKLLARVPLAEQEQGTGEKRCLDEPCLLSDEPACVRDASFQRTEEEPREQSADKALRDT